MVTFLTYFMEPIHVVLVLGQKFIFLSTQQLPIIHQGWDHIVVRIDAQRHLLV